MREASVPVNIEKLVEFVCAGRDGSEEAAVPSRTFRVAYPNRHTCRAIIHLERLAPEEGTQEITLRMWVTRPDGSQREPSKVDQRLILRPGGERRSVPVQGDLEQFDRIFVQVAHVADESRYALSSFDRVGLPALQWTAIVAGGVNKGQGRSQRSLMNCTY